ncbi:hypothetical protein GGR03_004657 [Aurantimonas endophytica]|uniref:Ankyrin repeat protein n=2 Tax=Aurantimonas endophytica TaxID=1522175 RepID=A0A7W6MRY7_9HYPH|nr:ankyrin repeat domain-containing protein [Aurantimonas endophytica]MBB4005555.1 hypothetical protein [Aurantimonas endophytica]MCO6406475.1 hypothetical protein [Aurantimonas endophytica]
MLVKSSIDELKAVFDRCEVDARGGYTEQVALAFDLCPEELARWLRDKGADLSAEDRYGDTPLHAHAGSYRGNLAMLLALGAIVDHGSGTRKGTALHRAATAAHPDNVRFLLSHEAEIDSVDGQGKTPLYRALQHASNASLERVAEVARLLVEAGARVTPAFAEQVERIGADFEFYRDGFNPESVDLTSAALDSLYTLFDVPPVPRRTVHNGTSRIVVSKGSWQAGFEELWNLLIPSAGAARTVQGEVVRIAGKIRHELEGNGGVNWDHQFRQMADAWMEHVGSGEPLTASEAAEATKLMAEIKSRSGDTDRMCELAVRWVSRNPDPVELTPPRYER